MKKKLIDRPQSTVVAHASWDVTYWATKIITVHEWFRECAYKDHTRYSIWFGTIAHKWECITYEEWLRRFGLELKSRIAVIQRDYPNMKPRQQGALVSLKYNCNGCYAGVWSSVTRWDFNRSTSIVKKYPWLAKRAENEFNLFTYAVVY